MIRLFFASIFLYGIAVLVPSSVCQPQIVRYQSWDELVALSVKNSKPLVVNFWATWCRPCVEELPEFFDLCTQHADSVKVVLVNMDFESKVATVVEPFIRRRNFTCEVARLPHHLEDAFIQSVSGTWSGALPFTVILKNGHILYEQEDRITAREILDILQHAH